jgi:hypothetical protein
MTVFFQLFPDKNKKTPTASTTPTISLLSYLEAQLFKQTSQILA